jgi:uncharacterized protein (DUF2236 family)
MLTRGMLLKGSILMLILEGLHPQLIYILFKHSVLTSKKTQRFAVTKTKWLMLFVEIIATSSENIETINILCRQDNK